MKKWLIVFAGLAFSATVSAGNTGETAKEAHAKAGCESKARLVEWKKKHGFTGAWGGRIEKIEPQQAEQVDRTPNAAETTTRSLENFI